MKPTSLSVLALAALSLTSCTLNPPPAPAKNVILFIGDGMGMSTITAARIFEGQQLGASGEEHLLSFEYFDHLALVKTYNLDSQVPDSAGTASAMMTGIKTQIGKVNVSPDSLHAGCGLSSFSGPTTVADMARAAGLSVGIVTTTRLTHATPAAVYGHSRHRDFESDIHLDDEAKAMSCPDLAKQLIRADVNIALGGGRDAFNAELRDDKTDIAASWELKSDNHRLVMDYDELESATQDGADILGLFSESHLAFEADRHLTEQPSLTELTEAAITNLAARETGYFLMVEGGRIDHAHHGTNAYRALTETTQMASAVSKALEMTQAEDTLILVTADHSHVMTMAGYPRRGNPILGLVKSVGAEEYSRDLFGNPYTTLGYQNGPHISKAEESLTDEMVQAPDFQQRTAISLEAETHAGEDVVLYAHGAGADRVGGVIDQTEIFTIMTQALGLEPKK